MGYSHAPVLLEETITGLAICPDGVYVDGTLGGGGHGAEVCDRLDQQGTFLGIDRDEDALMATEERFTHWETPFPCRWELIHDNFARIKGILAERRIPSIQGAVLDLGVSSFQLDQAERGFSYMQDVPLDMRMDQTQGQTASHIVNTYSEKDLADLIRRYGEERWATRIAAFITEARREQPIQRSGQLVEIIKQAIPAAARRQGPHPAKRTFQALRIEVNGELEILEQALHDFLDVLAPGGRLCVITFHSLEDRTAKTVFQKRANPCTCPPGRPCVCGKVPDIRRITGKPIEARKEELEINPRARSAKLRVAEKIEITKG